MAQRRRADRARRGRHRLRAVRRAAGGRAGAAPADGVVDARPRPARQPGVRGRRDRRRPAGALLEPGGGDPLRRARVARPVRGHPRPRADPGGDDPGAAAPHSGDAAAEDGPAAGGSAGGLGEPRPGAHRARAARPGRAGARRRLRASVARARRRPGGACGDGRPGARRRVDAAVGVDDLEPRRRRRPCLEAAADGVTRGAAGTAQRRSPPTPPRRACTSTTTATR